MSVSCVRLSVAAARLMPVLGKYIRRRRFLCSRTKGSQEKGVPGDSMVTKKKKGGGYPQQACDELGDAQV